jgi:transcriptional regulator with AAA-type ATPase domain
MRDTNATREARAVAALVRPVLIVGARGTGKTTAARQLHQWSGRRGKLVEVNVSALSSSLFESELFGHKRGSFTGAQADKQGLFEVADGGTLFLDEIGELDPSLQVKLLGVAESGEFWPVGASSPRRASVRLIAATNRDPAVLRPDLLDRFCWLLRLPTLAERGDALELARAYLPEASAELGRAVTLGAAAAEWVTSFHWPGNIRQLRHAVLVAGAFSDGEITPAQLERATGCSLRPSLEDSARRLTSETGWWSAALLAELAGVPASTARAWCGAHCSSNGKAVRWRLWRWPSGGRESGPPESTGVDH